MRMFEYQLSSPLRMELAPIQVMFTFHLVHGGLHPPKSVSLAVSISIILHTAGSCTSMQNRCKQDMEQRTFHHAVRPVPAQADHCRHPVRGQLSCELLL